MDHPKGARPCPTCQKTGEVFERDGAGGYFTECPDCYGTAEVGFKSTRSPDDAHREFKARQTAEASA
jgi:hypothetical protein